MKKTNNFGTQEWAAKTVNCCTGCSHDCLYCYAKSMAIKFKQVTPEQWHLERIRPKDVSKRHKFPSVPAMIGFCRILQLEGI